MVGGMMVGRAMNSNLGLPLMGLSDIVQLKCVKCREADYLAATTWMPKVMETVGWYLFL